MIPRDYITERRAEAPWVQDIQVEQDLAERVIYRTCRSYDCVCPQHIRRGTRRQALSAQAARGTMATAAKTAANRAAGLLRSRVSAELRQWIAESQQPATHVAHALGCAHTHVSELRRKARVAALNV